MSLALAGLACLLLWQVPSAVHAYSSFDDYVRPILEGGGGGKLFTGTPADGYTCDVCHGGAEGATLDVIGLPEQGYIPGTTYEIAFQWPATAPRVALMAEFTDVAGNPAGISALIPYMRWVDAEKCSDGEFPAADICRAGPEPGCCRDLDPTRDACSFPGERSVLWMLECGARAARMTWTAPAQAVDVWFSASLLSSNAGNDVQGDGVTLLRRRLRAAGTSQLRTEAIGGCHVHTAGRDRSGGQSAAAGWLAVFALGCASVAWRRKRRLS